MDFKRLFRALGKASVFVLALAIIVGLFTVAVVNFGVYGLVGFLTIITFVPVTVIFY
jgi:hypothetical protein